MERAAADDFAAELASTLYWWAEAGVDSLVAEEPRQWLKVPETPTAPLLSDEFHQGREHAEEGRQPRGATAPATIEPAEVLPDQLSLFHEWLRTSATLPYASPRAARVCPAGDPAAGLMILAAMPSAEDCAQAVLLSGSAGRLFDRMLAAIGRDRDTIYLAGLSCIRPSAGRLDAQGAARCATLARHHIGLAEPRTVLLLGDMCARAVLGLSAAQARGRVHTIEAGERSFQAVVTFGPDFLLTQPKAKAHAWADLQLLMETL